MSSCHSTASQPPLPPLSGCSSILPGLFCRGCTKQRRWADDNVGEESDDDHPTSYLDAVHRPVKPTAASPPRCHARPLVLQGCSAVDARRQRLGRRRRRCSQPRSQLVAACRLGQWMVVSLPVNVLVTTDGSLPPMPMGGGRSFLGRRRSPWPPRLGIAQSSSCWPAREDHLEAVMRFHHHV